jgi:membrane-associated phospholipid phosphatase
MKKLLLPVIIATLSTNCVAQGDTAYDNNNRSGLWGSKGLQVAYAPAGFFTASAISWGQRDKVRELRNRYIPTFRHHYDDYLQYLPLLTVVGLNTAGVKGKHTPKRALVSYAFSAVIMGVVVNSIKYTSKVERPDGSSRNSFPSGHTANSFMNASVLHKEYGQYRNPLYSVAAYTASTATAIGRQLNNRHWISDVLAGAGIGILSTELGYIIADKVFKNKGNNPPLKYNPFPIDKKPSFIEMRAGAAFLFDKDAAFGTDELTTKRGFNLGLEGAYFFSKNIGFGGEFAFSSFPINSDKLNLDPDFRDLGDGYYTQPMGIRYLTIGPFFSIPLQQNWFITGKLNAGASSGAEGTVNLDLSDDYTDAFGSPEIQIVKYRPEAAFAWSAGIGVQKRIGRNTALKFYSTYFDSKNRFRLDAVNDVDNVTGEYKYETIAEDKVDFKHLSFGLALTAFLW